MGTYSSYQANFTANTTRFPSPAIFHELDVMREQDGAVWGRFDDFDNFPMAPTLTTEIAFPPYKVFGSSGATILPGDAVGGVIQLIETTADESIAIAQEVQPFQIINTGGMLGFEARLKFSTVDGTADSSFIIGLASNRTLIVGDPLAVGGAMISTLSFVGFQLFEADGDAMDTTHQESAVTPVVHQADAVTLVADTYVKVGLLFEPQKKLLTFFQNGVPLSTTKSISDTASDAFPNDIRLGMIMAHMAGADDPVTVDVDWWKCLQAESPMHGLG